MSKGSGICKFVVGFSAVLLLCGRNTAAVLPFPVGEQLHYSISWNGIPVAHCTATAQMEHFEGREVLALRLRTQTCAFFNRVFKVDDAHESLVDLDTLRPIRFTKNLNEGRYRCHEVTRFDFKAMKAHYEHQTNGRKKTYDIRADTRDVLSFMYFMRSEQLEENDSPAYTLMADEKLYDLTLKTGAIKKIGLSNYDRKVPSLEMVPQAMFDGLFVQKGKARVWVSRDPRRLLTFAKIKVPFGRARVKLKSVHGPGNDFWIAELENKDDE